MKKLVLLIVFFQIFSCQTKMKNISSPKEVNKKIINEKKCIIQASQPEIIPDIIEEAPPEKVKKIKKNEKFTGLIENFEKKLKYWSFKATNESSLIKIDDNNSTYIGKFLFQAPYYKDEFHPYVNIIIYNRKMNFKPYNGIRFHVKGDSNFLYKIKILETETYYSDFDVKEVWYTTFSVSKNWTTHEILFTDLRVEEYWEQDYVSDNIQSFSNIAGICITAQNRYLNSKRKGSLLIDDIELF